MTGVACSVCPNGCVLKEGAVGACRARRNVGGEMVAEAYGRATGIAWDPVEKKPLARWQPGGWVLSIGGYGCNLHCPWCQNASISQAGERDVHWRTVSPEALVSAAARERAKDPRVVGLAYTYNEPLICWEYVRDCARIAHGVELGNVLVSNGCVNGWVVDELAPLIDAANIDLKAFRQETYARCGGSLDAVKACITRLAAEPTCHLEVTWLVVPGVNDTADELREACKWLMSVDPGIVLHVTRYHPAWKMDEPATPVATVYRLAEVARETVPFVYVGNC